MRDGTRFLGKIVPSVIKSFISWAHAPEITNFYFIPSSADDETLRGLLCGGLFGQPLNHREIIKGKGGECAKKKWKKRTAKHFRAEKSRVDVEKVQLTMARRAFYQNTEF